MKKALHYNTIILLAPYLKRRCGLFSKKPSHIKWSTDLCNSDLSLTTAKYLTRGSWAIRSRNTHMRWLLMSDIYVTSHTGTHTHLERTSVMGSLFSKGLERQRKSQTPGASFLWTANVVRGTVRRFSGTTWDIRFILIGSCQCIWQLRWKPGTSIVHANVWLTWTVSYMTSWAEGETFHLFFSAQLV